MTLPYEDNPMPHVLSVQCPDCSLEARFEFMKCVKIRLKKDLEYFQKSNFFEHRKEVNHNGEGQNLACYYHKLDQRNLPDISNLPDGYSISDWEHSQYLYRAHGLEIGAVACVNCGLRRKHNLVWPKDAYFQIQYKQQRLWAFDRECAAELLSFIGSKDRDRTKYKYRLFLLKVPAHFLTKNARDVIAKRLSAKLNVKT